MLQFYCDVLGCKIERTQEELGLTQLRAGRSLIDLITVEGKLGILDGKPPGAEGRNMDHLCLRVEPYDAELIYAQLRKYGIEAGQEDSRYGAEGEGPSIYLKDPEENTIELKGAPWNS